VGADFLYRCIELGQTGGGARIAKAANKDGNETCNAGNPGRHGIHRILTRARLAL
jgi:hypothetical protein